MASYLDPLVRGLESDLEAAESRIAELEAQLAAAATVIERSTFGPLASMEAGEVLVQLRTLAALPLAAGKEAEAVDDLAEYLGPEVDAALEEWRARWKDTHHADP